VTGADTGIGWAIARRLQADGFALAFHTRDDEHDAKSRYEEIAASGRAAWVIGDVSDPATCDRLVRETVEKLDGIEPFHPERMAARILGMGDILSLVEEAHAKIDLEEAQRVAEKVKKGKGFDLEDFKGQVQQMKKMGGLASLVDKLPAHIAQAAQGAPQLADGRALARIEGIINSMTPAERAKPELIKASRKRRIAAGAGVPVQEVNRLLKQFDEMQKMMKQMQKGGLARMLRAMKGFVPGPR